LAHDDPLVRAHAVWAARRLGADRLTAVCASDPDPLVIAELASPVAARAGSPSDSTAHASPGATR
jgi:hypothetical protein